MLEEKYLKKDEYVIAEYRDGYYCIVKISEDGECKGQGIYVDHETVHKVRKEENHFIENNNRYSGRSSISRFATAQEAAWLEACIAANAYVEMPVKTKNKKHRKATPEQLAKAQNVLSKYLQDDAE